MVKDVHTFRDAEWDAIRVETEEEFETAADVLFRSGQPIEAPSMEALERWGIDLEDEGGGIPEEER